MAQATKKKKVDKELTRLLTPEFRVSYPHVFKPQSVKPTDKPKYSVVMLFPKDSDLSAIKKVIRQAKINEFGPDKDDWPDDLESPVIDGDLPKYADKAGYKGHFAIKASTNEDQKPGVVGPEVDPNTGKLEILTTVAEFYPGCYARAYVFARCWEYMGKQGVQFILDHVQKTRDGESFGGKKPADQVFAPIESDDESTEAEEEESF